MKNLFSVVFVSVLFVCVAACGPDPGPVSLTGGAQKGPYQAGSNVQCNKLDINGSPTSETIPTTTDATGMFTINVTVGLYLCQAAGFYWKEDEGRFSSSSTTMYALVNVTVDGANSVFINPRTNFVAKRAIALIAGGVAADAAVVQAEGEINDMGFSIPAPGGLPLSTSMNLLGGDNDANREVFRVDCALMYAAQIKAADPSERDAQLQLLLNRGALEVAGDGKFSDDFKDLMAQAERVMNPEVCTTYLQKFITDTGLSGITLPNIQAVVDTDGNGVANASEPNIGMVLVPAGDFVMGPPNDETIVNLSDFYIDTYEVTLVDYEACVEDTVCDIPGGDSNCNWGVTGREFHPINCTTWAQADAYCQWIGKRLPTDAEWEKAARGTDGRIYPWGDSPEPSCDNSVIISLQSQKAGCGDNSTQPVGSRLSGDSLYGAKDMIGNVFEWTAEEHWRGGSYQSITLFESGLETYSLGWDGPIHNGDTYGFRCAKDAQ